MFRIITVLIFFVFVMPSARAGSMASHILSPFSQPHLDWWSRGASFFGLRRAQTRDPDSSTSATQRHGLNHQVRRWMPLWTCCCRRTQQVWGDSLDGKLSLFRTCQTCVRICTNCNEEHDSVWDETAAETFYMTNTSIAKPTSMTYLDHTEDTIIQCDASSTGKDETLMQSGVYASSICKPGTM